MHLPDGQLNLECCAAAAAVGVAVIGLAAHRVARERGSRPGAFSTALFAVPLITLLQFCDFPVNGEGTGHLLGAAALAILVGPWRALLALFCVTCGQALLFGDGGLAAMGANFLGLGVAAGLVGAGVNESFRRTAFPARLAAPFLAGVLSHLAATCATGVFLLVGSSAPASLPTASFLLPPALAEGAFTLAVALVFVRTSAPFHLGVPTVVPTTTSSLSLHLSRSSKGNQNSTTNTPDNQS